MFWAIRSERNEHRGRPHGEKETSCEFGQCPPAKSPIHDKQGKRRVVTQTVLPLADQQLLRKDTSMSGNLNVLALVKDGERYVFTYDDSSVPQLLQTLGRYAADPELNFSWYDAAVLSQRVRRLKETSCPAPTSAPIRRIA